MFFTGSHSMLHDLVGLFGGLGIGGSGGCGTGVGGSGGCGTGVGGAGVGGLY